MYTTLETLSRGKLKDTVYPSALASSTGNKPMEIVIFIVGGATYEEAMRVAEFNGANPTMRVILGGSCIHNSRSFLEEIGQAF